jgi:mono/diheme cytochrome c family protein
MRKVVLSLIVLAAISFACQENPQVKTEDTSAERHSKAQAYLKLNCQSCHSPTANHDSRLAPPFFAIQKRYWQEYPEQAEFEQALIDFINTPTEEHALMAGAIAKFGLMPPMLVEPEEAKALATYLYEVKQKKPQHLAENEAKTPEQKAKQVAMNTKKVLGKNLMSALKKGGKEHALSFCNVRAIPLTDSMSQNLMHAIKRVSDKARNPNNSANYDEQAIINYYATLLEKGEELQAQVVQSGKGSIGYVPITTNPMCLQCHGSLGKELDPTFYQQVKSLYPEDRAIGYGPGEIRGLWVVALDSL